MELDHETVTEIVVSVAGVLVFIVALVVVGLSFNGDTGLSPAGGLALVALVVAFILVFTGIGWWLSSREG